MTRRPPAPAVERRRSPTMADVVIATARTLVDARGVVMVGALVDALAARGMSTRAAHAALDIMSPGRLAVLRAGPSTRPHRELEPLRFGSPWVATKIKPAGPRRPGPAATPPGPPRRAPLATRRG